MKVVIALYSLSIGGSEILGRNLAMELQRQGHTPSVCAINHDGILSEELQQSGIPTVVIDKKPGEYIKAMWRVWVSFKKFKPDVVHTHHLYVLIYCFLAAKLVGARLIHTEHEYFSLLSPKKKRMLRILSIFCDRVTGVEDDVTAFLKNEVRINPRKLTTIRNGIDIDQFSGTSNLSREDLGIPGDAPIIGIVARLEPVKNHTTLLKAFARLQNKHPAHLLIIGDGSLRKTLEQECGNLGIADCVTFTGPRHDIPDLLKLIDIFVLCSLEEGLPIALLEAMAAAKPIVATDVGSISKVIIDGVNGLLVKKEDSISLSDKISDLLVDKDFAERLKYKAFATIKKHFDFKRTLNEYLLAFKG